MRHSHKIALRVSIIYIILGIIWVITTDLLSLDYSYDSVQRFATFQKSKGWLYIFLTGFVLYGIIVYWTEKLLDSQKELQVTFEQYKSLFMQNPDAVLVLNREGTIMSINPQAERLFEVKEEALKNKSAKMLLPLEEQNQIVSSFYQVLNKETVKFEITINVKESKIIRCSLFPIIVTEEIFGVYAVLRDVTHIRHEEELMIRSEKSSVIGHLAASVAHEIRNPLTSIKGFIQLMQSTNELNPRYLDIMLEEINRINTITSEMLILGKNQEVSYHRLDIRESINHVLTLMKAQTNLNNIELLYQKTNQPVMIKANDAQIKQVLINLIKNSIEAISTDGKISIGLKESGNEAVLTIADNGAGMEPERLKRIGELFYSTKEKGTGIGLAVCKKIIQRHNGEISFKSEKNKGTIVTIRIPLAKEQMVL